MRRSFRALLGLFAMFACIATLDHESVAQQVKISQYPAVPSPSLSDVLLGDHGGTSGVGGTTSKFPLGPLAALIAGNLGTPATLGSILPLAAPTPPASSSIVFFGDSITAGTGATSCTGSSASPSGTCYADLVSAFYGATEVNTGIPGSTLEHSSQSGAPSSGIDRYSSAILSSCTASNWLVLLYGINDIGLTYVSNSPTLSVSNYKTNLDTIITACKANGMPYGHMILVGLTYVDSTGSAIAGLGAGSPQPSGFLARAQTFTAAVAQEAQKRGTLYAPTYGVMQQGGTSILYSDGLHPNNTGHSILATAIENASYVQGTGEINGPLAVASALGGGTSPAVVNGMTIGSNSLTAYQDGNLSLYSNAASGTNQQYVAVNFGVSGASNAVAQSGGFAVGDGSGSHYSLQLPTSLTGNSGSNYAINSGGSSTYVSVNYTAGGTGGLAVGGGGGTTTYALLTPTGDTYNAAAPVSWNSNYAGSSPVYALNASSSPTGDLLDLQLGGITMTKFTNAGGAIFTSNTTATGSVSAGSATGATLSSGDLGASRSTTTGLIRIGGSSSACATDWNMTITSYETVSCSESISGNLQANNAIQAGNATAPSVPSGDMAASRSTTTGAITLGGTSSSCREDFGVGTVGSMTLNCPTIVVGSIATSAGANINSGNSANGNSAALNPTLYLYGAGGGTWFGSTLYGDAAGNFQYGMVTAASQDGWAFLTEAATPGLQSALTRVGNIDASGNTRMNGSIAAGQGTGATLTAGDLGASRSTSTGAMYLGGSASSCKTDFGLTSASTETIGCPLTTTGVLSFSSSGTSLSSGAVSHCGVTDNGWILYNGSSYYVSGDTSGDIGVCGSITAAGATLTTPLAVTSGGTGGGIGAGAASTVNSGALNTTETVLATDAIGTASLAAGTTFEVKLFGTCTSTAANASTFTLRFGTTGTTSDASVGTWTITSATSGSAIPFSSDLLLTVRTIGASASSAGEMTLWNGSTGGATTGIAAADTTVAPLSTSSFASNISSGIFSVTYKSAATTTTTTFQNAIITALHS